MKHCIIYSLNSSVILALIVQMLKPGQPEVRNHNKNRKAWLGRSWPSPTGRKRFHCHFLYSRHLLSR